MTEIILILLLATSGILAGIAVAAGMIVHYSMMQVPVATALKFFTPFFHRSAYVMLILAIAVFVLSLFASFATHNWWYLVVGTFLQLSGPYTLKVLMPVNNRLMAKDVNPDDPAIQNDLKGWGKLHSIRTVIAIIALICFLVLSL